MSESRHTYPHAAWISGRETWKDSLAYGEVVVPEVRVWQRPGSLPRAGGVAGEVSHGSPVTVFAEEQILEDRQKYYQVSTGSLDGWVSQSFVSWSWSSFTFIGNLRPADACKSLDVSIDYAGMDLLIKQAGFAIVTQGDPDHFDPISFATSRFIERVTNALAPLTVLALRPEFSNWVIVSIDPQQAQKEVGFTSLRREKPVVVSSDDIETAHSIVPLMATIPYLDLTLSDFYQALNYPQHAPIFLARAIESVENYFSNIAKTRKGVGKEKITSELLGVKKTDVEYVTRRANASHRRHASPDATAVELPPEELAECFKKTSEIIVAFVTFLRNTGL